jgi:hypothetical protein
LLQREGRREARNGPNFTPGIAIVFGEHGSDSDAQGGRQCVGRGSACLGDPQHQVRDTLARLQHAEAEVDQRQEAAGQEA